MKRRLALALGGLVLVGGMSAGVGGGAFGYIVKGTNSQGNCNAVFSSQVKQNGPTVEDQTSPGEGRSDLVHEQIDATC